jgi:hypothetical protein
MTVLSKLKLTDESRAKTPASPLARLRGKMIAGIEEQIAILAADQKGEQHIKRAMRWAEDPQTGERVRREVPIRVRRWYWRDATTGKAFVQLRYGNKPIELQKGKPTVEVANGDQLAATLNTILDAVKAGELDKVLEEARNTRRSGFKRRSK